MTAAPSILPRRKQGLGRGQPRVTRCPLGTSTAWGHHLTSGIHSVQSPDTPQIWSSCPVYLLIPWSTKAPSLCHHLPTTRAVDLKLGSKGQRPLPSSRRTLPASSWAKVKLAMFCGGVDEWLRAETQKQEVHSREVCRSPSVCPPYPVVCVKACVVDREEKWLGKQSWSQGEQHNNASPAISDSKTCVPKQPQCYPLLGHVGHVGHVGQEHGVGIC